MKRSRKLGSLTLVIIWLIAAIPAIADSTSELLEAPRVKVFVKTKFDAVSIGGGKPEHRIQYLVDDQGNYEVLTDGVTIKALKTIELRYPDFNPLKHAIAAKEEISDDPIAKQLSDFVNALSGTITTIFPTAAFGAGGGAGSDCDAEHTGCIRAARFAVNQSKATDDCKAMLRDCRCGALRRVIGGVVVDPDQILGIISEATLNGWVLDATGHAGVVKVHGDVKSKITLVNTQLQKAVDAHAELKAAKEKIATTCADVDPSQIDISLQLADEVIEEGKKLLTSLTALEAYLQPFTVRGDWRDGSKPLSDYRYFTTSATAEKMKTISIEAQERTLKLTDGAVMLSADKSATTKTRLRFGRGIVPEVGVAVVYNELKYPKYKAETVDGKLRVAENGFADSNVEGALMLNLLWNTGLDFGYPGVQFGVSSAKDFPGFLGGFVFRFAKPKRFSLATGSMVTWFKDLNKLSVGSEIEKEADIAADLKRRRSSAEWYFAVQYSF